MTVSISTIKRESKAAFKGKWIMAIIAALTLVFLYIIIQNIAYLLSTVLGEGIAIVTMFVMMLLLCCPLLFGVLRYFWRIFGGVDESPIAVFYYFSAFSLYYKALKLCVMLALRLLFLCLIFYLPAIVVSVISTPKFYQFIDIPIPIWSQNLSYLVNFLSSIASVLVWVSLIKFYLAPILVIADEKMDVDEALHMSSVISKGSLMEFIFLLLSFIGWGILSLLFVPIIFTLPYFLMCYTVHCLYSIKDYNEKIKRLNDENFPSFVAGV